MTADEAEAPLSGTGDVRAAGSRRDFMLTTARLLWPAPATVELAPRGRRSRAGVREFRVVPDAARARLVVPADAPRAAAEIARRSAPRGLVGRAATRGLAVALGRRRLAPLLGDRLEVEIPGPEAEAATIEAFLGEVLGREVVVGLYVSRPRANRKPVLQALSPDGTPLAYVKIGMDELTRDLVAREAGALNQVGGSVPGRAWTAPRLLANPSWSGLDVLVQSVLPVWRHRAELDRGRLAAVAAGVAATAGVETVEPDRSAYATRLRERLARLPAGPGGVLRGFLDRTLAAHGSVPLPFGAWHGDFTEWNLAALRDTVLVWDWERYETGVPVGYDLVHFHLWRRLLAPGVDVPALLQALPSASASHLAGLGLDTAEAEVVARLYLAEILARYLHDGQDRSGQLATVIPTMLDTLATL